MGLVHCTECGRQVSAKASSCPGCGAPRRHRRGLRALVVLSTCFVGVLALVIASLPGQDSGRQGSVAGHQASMQGQPRPATVTTRPEPSPEQIDAAIRDSDDYATHQDAFLKATATLAQRERSSLQYVRENGGWVRSQTHKPRPVYFTYVGGPHVDNRVYLDVTTGKLFK